MAMAAVVALPQSAERYQIYILARVEHTTGPDAIPPNKTYVTPVANTTFTLFTEDPAAALDLKGMKVTRYESHGEDHRVALLSDYFAAQRVIQNCDGSESGFKYLCDYYVLAAPVLRHLTIQTGITNRQGITVFEGIAPGVYFLAGSASPPMSQTWNVKVEVRNAPVSVRLSDLNRMKAAAFR